MHLEALPPLLWAFEALSAAHYAACYIRYQPYTVAYWCTGLFCLVENPWATGDEYTGFVLTTLSRILEASTRAAFTATG